MNKDVQHKKLFKYIENQDYIQIRRKNPNEVYTCIPLAISKQFLMVLRFYDFDPYGYEVFPVSSIVDISHSDTDIYFGDIVKKEGASIQIATAPSIDLLSWRSILSFFLPSGENVTVDIGKADCVNVGQITKTTNTSFCMRCFSPTGVWDDDDWSEPYKNITGIQFRNHYLQTFTKYLPPKEDTKKTRRHRDGSSVLMKSPKGDDIPPNSETNE